MGLANSELCEMDLLWQEHYSTKLGLKMLYVFGEHYMSIGIRSQGLDSTDSQLQMKPITYFWYFELVSD